jgi:hypothetical protein
VNPGRAEGAVPQEPNAAEDTDGLEGGEHSPHSGPDAVGLLAEKSGRWAQEPPHQSSRGLGLVLGAVLSETLTSSEPARRAPRRPTPGVASLSLLELDLESIQAL